MATACTLLAKRLTVFMQLQKQLQQFEQPTALIRTQLSVTIMVIHPQHATPTLPTPAIVTYPRYLDPKPISNQGFMLGKKKAKMRSVMV